MRIPASLVFLGGIALLCVGAGIGLVIVSSKSRHMLVRDDYYRDGLKLDAYRVREAAFDSLGVSLSLREEKGALILEAGGPGAGDPAVRARLAGLSLSLRLRRPDDRSLDSDPALTLASDSPPLWVADAAPLRHGRWNVRAVFTDAQGEAVMENGFAYTAP